jgi:hypothetical protein
MNSITAHIAGWLIVGLTVLPLMSADAGQEPSAAPDERLEWLLASHDVRQAIHAPRASGDCGRRQRESNR